MPDLIRLLLSIRLLSSLAIAGAPASATAAELDIVNASGTTIHELYVAAAGERSWGPDRLRSKQPNVIARGETHRISDLAPAESRRWPRRWLHSRPPY